MADGESFATVHAGLVDCGVAVNEAFTITARVFRSGGLTKDAVYLRGLRSIISHIGAGGVLDGLWLGKMSLTDLPHINDLREPRHPARPTARASLPRRPGSAAASRQRHRIDHTGRPARLNPCVPPADRRTTMRIGFVVNDVDTEQPQYTTTRLALAATRRGHDVWLMGVGDFAHRADGSIGAKARAPSRRKHRSLPSYLGSVQSADETSTTSPSTSSTSS